MMVVMGIRLMKQHCTRSWKSARKACRKARNLVNQASISSSQTTPARASRPSPGQVGA